MFFRNRNGCKHFLLAVNELLHLDLSSEGVKSSRIQDAIRAIAGIVIPTDGMVTPTDGIVIPTDGIVTPTDGMVTPTDGMVIPTDGIHTIISSLNTNPFEEYIRGSQYTPHFVRLSPLLENLDHLSKLLSKLLSKILARKRNDESPELTIWQLLLSTGGHPKLISS